jgi:hypothetical protein
MSFLAEWQLCLSDVQILLMKDKDAGAEFQWGRPQQAIDSSDILWFNLCTLM